MENFSTILQTVWRPAQKNSWGGGGCINPPGRARVKMGTWNFLTFPTQSIGNVVPNFRVSTLRRCASKTTLSGACLPSFDHFFQIFGNCKNLIVCDGLVYWETCPEIWPKSFKKQRSYNNFKHLVKKGGCYFWPPEPQIFGFFFIFENGNEGSRWEKSNDVYPIEIGLRFSRSQGRGAESAPAHQLTRALLGLWIFHRLLGGGGVWTPPPMISAPGRRREKRKAAFESSRKII